MSKPDKLRTLPGTYRRHGAEVVSDALAEALDRWPDYFDGRTRDDVGHLRHILQDIADGLPPS